MADVVFRSSGTTGAPKEIVRTEASLEADARAIVEAFPEVWGGLPRVVSSARSDHLLGHLWAVRAPRIAGRWARLRGEISPNPSGGGASSLSSPNPSGGGASSLGSPNPSGGGASSLSSPNPSGGGVCPQVVISVEELVEACGEGAEPVVFVTTPSFLSKAVQHPDFASLRGKISSIIVSGGELRAEIAKAVVAAIGVCPPRLRGEISPNPSGGGESSLISPNPSGGGASSLSSPNPSGGGVLEIYGSTEAGTVAWRRQTEGGEAFTLQRGVEATVNEDGALVVDSPYAMARPFVMSDAVTFVAPRQFVLHGRLDRRVKVLEEFVSLPDVESAFLSHPLVADVRVEAFGDDVPRLGALVVLAPEGAERLASGTHAALASVLRRDLLPRLGERAFPRRIRFVRALPTDERGKTTASAVRAVLADWCREPAVLAWAETAARLDAMLAFPPDSECFDGHFPGFPILPGVAQLFFVRHFARQVFSDFPDDADYRKLKFQRIVRPGERIDMSVSRADDGVFSFVLSVGGERATGGEIRRNEQS